MPALRATLMLCVFWVLTVAKATATIIEYPFQVHADTGPLAGVTVSGTFSVDDSLAPLGGTGFVGFSGGLLAALDFTWNGVHYTSLPPDNHVGLSFRDGQLQWALFGFSPRADPDPGVDNCGASVGIEAWCVLVSSIEPGIFLYSTASPPNGIGDGTASAIGLISEPDILILLAVGLGLLAVALRRR